MTKLRQRSINTVLLMLLIISPAYSAGESQVKLQEEYVYIHIDKSRQAHVTVRFIFTGTRDYTRVLAFPVSSRVTMENFQVFWNGSPLPCEWTGAPEGRFFVMAGGRYRSLIKFTVPRTVTDRTEHIVNYTYRIPFFSLKKDYEAEGDYIEYILTTGSTWKGRVAKLKIVLISDIDYDGEIMHLDKSYIIRPAGKGKWEFNGSDIELDKDLKILMR